MNPLPYLTTDQRGVGGKIKERAEDFFVQEIPLYEPSGQGEHVYCEIEKIGILRNPVMSWEQFYGKKAAQAG